MPTIDPKITWPGWETVRLIGRGSFGAVYEIQRDVLGEKEKAALKVITIPQSSSDIDELYGEGYDDASITSTFQEHLKSIVAEYSLMRKLNGSSYVVNCDDVRYVQHEDGIGWDIFIKMELLTALNKALGETIPEEQVIRIGADICRALRLCRKHNIIHRDIKPANIFVSENGDYKLGDFGIAKTVEKTSGGTKIGTYEYMAPEVYHDEPYGAAADIYSLGMVLYWLLNERRTPFFLLPPALPTTSEKERARKRRFSGEEIPSPAHGSPALQRIVLKAIAYDQKDRYQSAEEMLRDLEAAGGDSGNDPHEGLHGTQEQISAGAGPDMSTGAGEEDATVGLFGTGKAKTVTAVANAAGDIHKPETEAAEEATVGLYGASKTKGTASADQELASLEKQTAREQKNGAPTEAQRSPAPETELPEEGTVGVFGAPKMEQMAAAPVGSQEQKPNPEEEGTVGLFKKGQEKQEKKADKPVKQEQSVKQAQPKPEKPAGEKKNGGKGKLIGILAAALVVIAAAVIFILHPFGKGASTSTSPAATEKPAATERPAATEKPAATAKPAATPKPELPVSFHDPVYTDDDGKAVFSNVSCTATEEGNEYVIEISFDFNDKYAMEHYPGYSGQINSEYYGDGNQNIEELDYDWDYSNPPREVYTIRINKNKTGDCRLWIIEVADGAAFAGLLIDYRIG